MMRLEHIGIAVNDLEKSNELFRRLLGEPHYKVEVVASEHVKTSFFRSGDAKVELLEATAPESAIARYIARRGEGIHHVAFEVSDIRAEMERLKEAGFQLLSDQPKRGADDKWVCFVHPGTANGVLVELCQSIGP